jgi:hypothetical protein
MTELKFQLACNWEYINPSDDGENGDKNGKTDRRRGRGTIGESGDDSKAKAKYCNRQKNLDTDKNVKAGGCFSYWYGKSMTDVISLSDIVSLGIRHCEH